MVAVLIVAAAVAVVVVVDAVRGCRFSILDCRLLPVVFVAAVVCSGCLASAAVVGLLKCIDQYVVEHVV